MNNKELRALRLKLGLTQAQMGQKLGILQQQVLKLETGKCKISGPVSILAEQLLKHHSNQ